MKAVSIDADLCAGHAECVDIAPDVFRLDDDGFAFVIEGAPVAAEFERVQLAALACPTEAIILADV